jgi:hypothetical protein
MLDFPSTQMLIHTLISTAIFFVSLLFLVIMAAATMTTQSTVAKPLRWATVVLFVGITLHNLYRSWYFWYYKPDSVQIVSLLIDGFRFFTLVFFWWAWASFRSNLNVQKIESVDTIRRT